jgi:hypothetical protein
MSGRHRGVLSVVWVLATRGSQIPRTFLLGADVTLEALVRRGIERSPTFERLVSQIEGHQGVVVVQRTPWLSPGLEGCLLPKVTAAPDGTRYLFVLVRRDLAPDRAAAVIGLELQHALEVLRSATPETATTEVFISLDGLDQTVDDTAAALAAGNAVLGELSGQRAHQASA